MTACPRAADALFTPEFIAHIEATANRLLDGLLRRQGQDSGRADLTTGFAALLPMEVIRQLLDVPAEDGKRPRRAVEAVMSHDEDRAPLARLEARAAVPPVVAKLPEPALDGEPSYRPSTVSRALSSCR